jgi:MerR family transcriptional regulator, light-induced transcriptional regulator
MWTCRNSDLQIAAGLSHFCLVFMADAHHPIKAVVRRTGLSAHVIRIWEKRYEAVTPGRTKTNRRIYSGDEIERLSLLRDVSRAGHNIGSVAKLPTEALRKLASEAQTAPGEALQTKTPASSELLVDECIKAVKRLDSRGLEDALNRGAIELGAQGLLQRVIAPLAQKIGELWRDGGITAAHEHFATAVIRIFLGNSAKSFAPTGDAPRLVVATLTGQLHELGALLAAALAVNLGWNVTYLGASLPAAEIAGAVRQNSARAVALSLVYPDDDERLEGELTRLRDLLPPEMPILVGGRVRAAYSNTLSKIGALQMKDLSQLGETLDDLRSATRNRVQ